ncbi:hypothetical protein ACFQGS_00065 [Novosphingobium lubricantis]
MIGPGSDAKVLIYTKPIDFRCGIDTLVAKVQHELSQIRGAESPIFFVPRGRTG